MAQKPGPEYHYYRAPYAILSFTTGLYCDPDWSLAEFTKWRESEMNWKHDDVDHEIYAYEGYLDPYEETMPLAIARLISKQIYEAPENTPDKDGRRAPNTAQCEKLWPYLLKELGEPAGTLKGKLPPFSAVKPAISTLAAIYLGNDALAEDALAYWDRQHNSAVKALFKEVHTLRGMPAVQAPLHKLKELIFKDLIESPKCW